MTSRWIGPYRLDTLLGRGGMGEVWRAVDTAHGDRVVALKLLGSWLNRSEEYVRRFRRESAVVANLGSRYVVPIHTYGEIDGQLFIDMQFVSGTDLETLISRDGPLSPRRAVGIIHQVAQALDAAHRAGLVHRDVKPSNVLLAECPDRDNTADDTDQAYLIDFGIARPTEGTRLSASGSVLGTMAYMAPERFLGQDDHRCDIYALGCVLYQALTGALPYPNTEPMALIRALEVTTPAPPSRLRPELSTELDRVIGRAMAKKPEQRHRSAVAFATDARQAVAARAPANRAAVTAVHRPDAATTAHRPPVDLLTPTPGADRSGPTVVVGPTRHPTPTPVTPTPPEPVPQARGHGRAIALVAAAVVVLAALVVVLVLLL